MEKPWQGLGKTLHDISGFLTRFRTWVNIYTKILNVIQKQNGKKKKKRVQMHCVKVLPILKCLYIEKMNVSHSAKIKVKEKQDCINHQIKM
jgi:hypothetical protein